MIFGRTRFTKLNVEDAGEDGWMAWMGNEPSVVPEDCVHLIY